MSIARANLLRRIHAAGWAAGAYVLLQLFAFPAVVWRVDGHWTWAPFAIFWLRGELAVLRAQRDADPSEAVA